MGLATRAGRSGPNKNSAVSFVVQSIIVYRSAGSVLSCKQILNMCVRFRNDQNVASGVRMSLICLCRRLPLSHADGHRMQCDGRLVGQRLYDG